MVRTTKHDGYDVAALSNRVLQRLQESGAEKRKKEKLWDDSCALLAGMFENVKAVANNVFFGSGSNSQSRF